MKREKLVTGSWAFFLAFVTGLSAVACVITGFDMAVDLKVIALWCGVASLVSSICYTLPLHPVPLCALSVTGVILWITGGLEKSAQALLYRISRQYHNAYGWGFYRVKHYTAGELETMLPMALCFLAVGITLAVAWAICRRKSAAPGVLLAALCLASCLVTDATVPDSIWLYGILFGVLLVMLTHTARRENGSRGNRLTAMAILPLGLFLLLLFGFLPQSRYTGQETAQTVVNAVLENDLFQAVFGDLSPAGNTGSSVSGGTVRLGSVGVRAQSQVEMMKVHTDFSGVLYLWGRALDTYDGLTWTDSEGDVSRLYWPEVEDLQPQGEVTIQTRYAHQMLYLPYYVQSMDLTGVTRGVENTKKLTQYSFTTGRLSADSEISALDTSLPEDASSYVHLTDAVKKWAVPLAQQITQGKETVYQQAQAIGDYVRNSARYDLKTSAMPAWKSDFAKWFLEESDTGYCVHFATSAVVLLQAAGIPARYVSGYMTPVGTDCYTIVREMDAHAWAEYWLPGFGWTVLEVTPAQLQEPDEELTPEPQEPAWQIDWKMAGWVLAGILLTALAALFVQRSVRLRLRRRKLQTGTVKQRLLAHWQETVRFARCLGGMPDGQLFAIAEKAKFSQHPPREEDLASFDRYLQDAKAQLKNHSLWRRFYYRFILALY